MLWAVHLPDGLLAEPWLIGGFVVAAGLGVLSARVVKLREENVARVALVAAAFFVASLIHVRVGASSVHLLLNGLVGVVLGWHAALAIPLGLFLQAALFNHGGFTTLGVNSCVMVLPALLARGVFVTMRRLPSFPLGFLVGAAAVLATITLNFLVLLWGGQEDWHTLALVTFVAHLPLAILEGTVLGFAVSFLRRVQPELLGEPPFHHLLPALPPQPSLEQSACLDGRPAHESASPLAHSGLELVRSDRAVQPGESAPA
jgi:cobalt/nickel transport system permease protein